MSAVDISVASAYVRIAIHAWEDESDLNLNLDSKALGLEFIMVIKCLDMEMFRIKCDGF